jgi:hypothetical protein
MKGAPALFIVLLLAIAGHRAGAQSRELCDDAVAIVTRSKLPPAADLDWNKWNLIARCGRTDAYIAALQAPQITSEVDRERTEALFGLYHGKRDGALFTAYAAAVSNNAASDAFRIAAMDALGGLVERNLVVNVPTIGNCTIGSRMGRIDSTPPSLPSNARVVAHETFAGVAAAAVSARVKMAAGCWEDLLDRHTPVDLRKISVAYVCGNKFRVVNDNHNMASLSYQLGDKDHTGEFDVRPRGERMLTVDTVATIQVYQGSTLVGSAINSGVKCR